MKKLATLQTIDIPITERNNAVMIFITPHFFLDETECDISFIRAPGPGGQNVNKVATAVQLRFNVWKSASLSDAVRARLIHLSGKKLTKQGELVIKASRFRTQERNKQDALDRLLALLKKVAVPQKKRKKTKVSAAAKERRLSSKKQRSKIKSLRQRNFD